MIFSAHSLFAVVVAMGSAVGALPSADVSASLVKRQGVPTANIVTCDFVLQPTAVVDPTNTNLLNFEFSNVIVNALGDTSTPANPTGLIVRFGSSFTANLDVNNTFNTHQRLGGQKLPADQAKAIMEGGVGTTLWGLSTN